MRCRKPHHLGSFDMIFLTVKMLSSLHSQWFECKPWSLFFLLWKNLPFTDIKKRSKRVFAIWTFLYFKILTVKMLSLHWMIWVHLKKHALILRKVDILSLFCFFSKQEIKNVWPIFGQGQSLLLVMLDNRSMHWFGNIVFSRKGSLKWFWHHKIQEDINRGVW